MQGIDRRAKDRLVAFTITNNERYTSLESYTSTQADFRDFVRAFLPDGWKVGENPGVWCEVHAPAGRTPDGGFKIHLSTAHDKAKETLEAVVPILVEEGVTFKVLVDEKILDLSNSTSWSRGACGKFVTIYPADVDQMKRLMERVDGVTRSFRGPYILSDKRYKDSKVLFYRYGAFKKAQRVNVFGEPIALVRSADGELIPDFRLPYFALPDGVSDPFPDAEEEEEEAPLNGRYKPVASLGSSSKGGVYRCIDLQTNMEVVVKEARPFVNRGRRNPYDAVDCLKNEYDVLKRLEGTGVTPKPIELFQEWEHSFLAMELATGMPLGKHLGSWRSSILLMTNPSADDVRRYCSEVITMARSILAVVRTIHAQGVVIQDISPRNILFDPESGKVTFIDFEAAYARQSDDSGLIIPIHTVGFGVAPRLGVAPTVAGDYKALSRILGEFLYPPTPFFTLSPQSRGPMLAHVAKEHGVPEAFVRLMLGIGEDVEKTDELIADAERSITSITQVAEPPKPLRSDSDLKKIIASIGSYIVEVSGDSGDPLDLPTDYRRFATNKLSVAYGASGVALFLKRTRGEVPEPFVEAISREVAKIDNQSYAPGLYVGSAGVAWTLLELGRQKEAEALLDLASKSPIVFENADMFYGAAGFGLANLFFWKRLGDDKYLKSAVAAFEQIKPMLKSEKGGLSYFNTDTVYHGFAHGAAGIGYFLLRLYEVTKDEEHLEVAKKLLDFEIASAEEEQPGYVVFKRSVEERVYYPYWRLGSAGVGAAALRFHAALGDERYLDLARKIARHLEGGYTVFPTNFSGMAGIGGFFVDLYRRTGEGSYLEEARRFVDRVMLFALEKPSGIVFPGEDLLRISTDYGTGSAGTGVFIHRIVSGEGVPYVDF